MNKFSGEYYCRLVKKNLKKLKDEKQWTIVKMAQELGISEGYLGNILSLKSKKVPTIFLLGTICSKLNLNMNYFFQE